MSYLMFFGYTVTARFDEVSVTSALEALRRHLPSVLKDHEATALAHERLSLDGLDHGERDTHLMEFLHQAWRDLNLRTSMMVSEPIPGTENTYILTGGIATAEHDPCDGYAAMLLLVELCERFERLGTALGILGQRIRA